MQRVETSTPPAFRLQLEALAMKCLASYVLTPLRQDRQYVLYRGHERDSDRPVLVLAPAAKVQSASSAARLEHEYALRALLGSGPCTRPLALLRDGQLTALVMEDPGGEPLDQALQLPLELTRFLAIAIDCAQALGDIHAGGLVHSDIRPANLLVDADGKVSLTGFGLAFQSTRGLHGGTEPSAVGRTFEYLAPEQTGRMNRGVDVRSDLYALGVVLYQLLVGALPFAASDAIEWMHAHIARHPVAPRERRSGIPEPVDAIVLKLLAKLPEERYQTAAGLVADLRSCLEAWEANARVDPFVLGAHDLSGQLQMARQLYGREAELLSLVTALSRVQASGECGVALLAGAAGAGKSSLVDEFRRSPAARDISFAMGKFEQHAGAIPYAALGQALQQLVRPLLALDDVALGKWKTRLLQALGLNGQLMVNLVPELGLLVGEQAPVQDARPQETQSRFYLALRRLLGVFATSERPLFLFLDDLQWADAATLAVLERLIIERDVPHMLVVCAYRPGEVGPSHPLARVMESITRSKEPIAQIRIDPLVRSDVQRLVVDALGGEGEGVNALAGLVYEKTGGNPFFTQQFLLALVDEGLLAFDRSTSRWHWDPARIVAKDMTANVADLIALKLHRLSDGARETLKHLACLGMTGKTSEVARLAGLAIENIEPALAEATSHQVVCCTDKGYRFIHDRVREAAYALIPQAERPAWHLRTGRVLASLCGGALETQVFKIVNHYNRGAALIHSELERQTLASMNLVAGRRARDAIALLESKGYFETGLALLCEDCWTRQFRLAFDLELGLAECEFLVGNLGAARSRLSDLLARAASPIDRAVATTRLVAALRSSGEVWKALDAGLNYFGELGIKWSARPDDKDVELELEEMWRRIGEAPIETLVDLPLMTDPRWRATMNMFIEVIPVAAYVSRSLLALMIARMVNLSLEHGNCDSSCIAYCSLTLIARERFTDYRAAFRFGDLSLALIERRGLTRFRGQALMAYGLQVSPWTQPLHTTRATMQKALDIALETGDVALRSYLTNCMLDLRIAAGDTLDHLRQAALDAIVFLDSANFGVITVNVLSKIIFIRSLCGLPPEADIEQRIVKDFSFEAYSPVHEYWIRKLQTCFFEGDYGGALDAAVKAEPGLSTTDAHIIGTDYHFFVALSRAAAGGTASAQEREVHLEAVRHTHRNIASCAELCPENFGHRAALIEAEIARLEGRALDAEGLYEAAIRLAHDQSFIHHEAVAYELAARFYDARGLQRVAEVYAQSARSCYFAWGAHGKVAQLERSFAHLRLKPAPSLPDAAAAATAERLDLETVAKLSQATTSEVALPRLIDVVMRLAIEQAGADRGVLILADGDEDRVEAEARAADSGIEIRLVEAERTAVEVPESILRYVARTGENLLIADASEPNLFSEDPYFLKFPGRSILCLPMVKQARLVGQLYLENRQVSDVFTPARFVVLKLLAAQAAISIENARLYAGLRRAEAAVGRAQQAERDRIARELHDTLLQSTQGLVLLFQHVAGRFGVGSPVRSELEAALDRAQAVIQEGRDRVAHLRVTTDGARDMAGALEAAAESLAVPGGAVYRTVVQGAERPLDEEVGEQAYRIGREALVNAFHHARASAIEIDIVYAVDEFRLRIADDGVGIDAQTLEAMSRDGHWGLIGMRERAHQMGARLEIRSRPGSGTEIELRIPARIAYGEAAAPSRVATYRELKTAFR